MAESAAASYCRLNGSVCLYPENMGYSLSRADAAAQECLHMEQGSEVCYLRRRHGFIRMALRHGAGISFDVSIRPCCSVLSRWSTSHEASR